MNYTKDSVLAQLTPFRDKVRATGVKAELVLPEDFETGGQWAVEMANVRVDVPNGRSNRPVHVFAEDVEIAASVDFENACVLGEYQAFVDRSTGMIEARIASSTPRGIVPASEFELRRIPGIVAKNAKDIPADALEVVSEARQSMDVEVDSDRRPLRRMETLRLVLERDGKRITLEEEDDPARAFLLGVRRGKVGLVIRIEGYDVGQHDEALQVLESVSGALFFEIDLLAGTNFSLLKLARRRRVRRGRERPASDVKFPRNEYAQEALALYQYGRSASGLPLLEFLAYYQAIEYFFPVFSYARTAEMIRTQLLNPSFDPTSDSDLARLIRLSAPAARAGISEREQLKAVIQAVLPVDHLREFIEAVDHKEQHFSAKSQRVVGMKPVRVDAADVGDQIAERLYTLRCRIVHTKQDGGPASETILLPTSPEASRIGPEIALAQLVAQQAMIARAKRVN